MKSKFKRIVMIKYILFDLDETLLDFSSSEKEALYLSFSNVNKTCNQEIYQEFKKINEMCFNEYASGKVSRSEFHKKRFELLLSEFNIDFEPIYINSIYVKNLSESAILYNDTLEILDYLKSKNYKLYIVSNGQKEVQLKRLTKSNIISYFDYIFISSEIGYNKPDTRVLEYALKKISELENKKDLKKEEFILIGDREEADIKCALDFGIKSVLIGVLGTKATYKCRNLSELKEIL